MAISLTVSTLTRSSSRCQSILISRQTSLKSRCHKRGLMTARVTLDATKMTPAAVSEVLRKEEFSSGDLYPEGTFSVRYFETNTLASNRPIEDSYSQAILNPSKANEPPSMLFGVYDGHGGASCGIVTANRLQYYISATLLSTEDLKSHYDRLKAAGNDVDAVQREMNSHITPFNDDWEMVHDLKRAHQRSYIEYVSDLFRQRVEDEDEASEGGMLSNKSVAEKIKEAFMKLDQDMSDEAIEHSGDDEVGLMTSTVALSGAVAVVAHVDGPMLHIASCGDCVAVLGSLSENETWVAKKLTVDHNADNQAEIKRILSEHPGEQKRSIFKGDRLLGMLAPVRAFGDFRFKWSAETIKNTIGNLLGHIAVPEYYKTPPYLTVEPDVIAQRLTPKDKFLVIGSDGLWDMMTPMQVIRLVGEHMQGKITLSPLELNEGVEVRLGDLMKVLKKRQAAMRLKPQDLNSATHLIRSALGGTAYGVDHGRLSQMLTLPPDMVRMFRDDITVTVIFFDQEFLRHC